MGREWGPDAWLRLDSQSALGLLCSCTPDSRKRTPALGSGEARGTAAGGGSVPAPVTSALLLNRPERRGGGGPRGLYLETHVPSKSLYFL